MPLSTLIRAALLIGLLTGSAAAQFPQSLGATDPSQQLKTAGPPIFGAPQPWSAVAPGEVPDPLITVVNGGVSSARAARRVRMAASSSSSSRTSISKRSGNKRTAAANRRARARARARAASR